MNECKLSLKRCLNLTPKCRKPKFLQFVVFPAICVQFMKVFVAKKNENIQKRTSYALCFKKEFQCSLRSSHHE